MTPNVLSIRITGDSSSVEAALSRTNTALNSTSQGVSSLAAAFIGGVAGGGLPTLIELVSRKTVGLVSAAIDAKGRLADLSAETGVSVENLASLAKVARYSDTQIESIAEASGRLSKALFTQNEDSAGAAAGIRALGIDFEKFKQLDADQRLLAIAKAMEGFRDGTGKSAVAMELWGREGQKLLPFMKELAQRGLETTTQTTAAALAAKEYADNLVTLTGAGEGLAHQLANELLPSLLNVTKQLLAGREAYGSWWAALKDVGLNVDPLKTLNENIAATTAEFKKLDAEAQKIKDRQKGGGFWADTFAKADASDLADIQAQQKVLEQRLAYLRKMQYEAGGRGSWGGASHLFAGEKPDLTPPPGSGDSKRARVAPDYLGEAEERINKLYERWWENDQETQDKIDAAETASFAARLKQADETTQGLIDANERAAAELIDNDRDRARALIEIDRATLLRKLDSLGIYGEEYAKQQDAIQAKYEIELKKLDKGLADTADKASQQLSDSIAEGMLDGFRNGQTFADVFLRELKAQFAKTILSPIIKPVVEQGNQAISGLLNLAASYIFGGGGATGTAGGWSFGGVTYNNPSAYVAGGRAAGGPVLAGSTYLVGERGPELLRMGAMGGQVVPNSQLGGRPVTINVINNGAPATARTSQRETPTGTVIDLVLDAVARDIQSGGRVHDAAQRRFGLNAGGSAPRY